eukprot:TRINITY_DN4059_c1_g1_i1.p1 TRINITY_DN4059_c1_g1~~TRINITY_DN4059_c1_g1_i1.p1  ORF type:complete len:761 (+),score=230.12 TRINITY_DN4059_c1_g1_i1:78-2360(+)
MLLACLAAAAALAGSDSETAASSNLTSSGTPVKGDECVGANERECKAEHACVWVNDTVCEVYATHHEGDGAHDGHDDDKVGFYMITVVVILAFVAVRLVQKFNQPWMSESGGVILIGAVIGLAVYGVEAITGNDYEELIEFNEHSFELFILPPIIFEAGYTLEHGGIMRNLGTILLFAVLGTLVSTVAIGGLLFWGAQATMPELYEAEGSVFMCMTFGAVLSAVDPVAVRLVQKFNQPWMSESGGVILIGAVIGLAVYGVEAITGNDYEELIEFNEHSFELFILPPIIFEAGYTLEHGGIMRNLGTILLFAVLGTLVSTVAIGGLLFWGAQATMPELYEAEGSVFMCMTFGAVLSAVDPVAVIAVLGQKFDLRYPPFLYNLVFGEAVLNDAVAIVVFEVMVEFVDQGKSFTAGAAAFAVLRFLKVSILSAILGYVYGALCALFMKHVQFKTHPEAEVILIGAFGMGSYYLAQVLHLSGIMSLFICARIQGHHALWNCSQETREHSKFIFKTVAHVAEMYVFALLGEAAFHSGHSWNWPFMGVAFAAMLAARALNIFPLSAVANFNRKRNKISGALQFFMWFGGLRGAIAFGLALLTLSRAREREARGEEGGISVEIARVFLTTVFLAVCVTVLVMGGFIDCILTRLGLDRPDQTGAGEDKEAALLQLPEAQGGQEVVRIDQAEVDRKERARFKKSRALMRRLAKFDEERIAPVLRSDVQHLDVDDSEVGSPKAEEMDRTDTYHGVDSVSGTSPGIVMEAV